MQRSAVLLLVLTALLVPSCRTPEPAAAAARRPVNAGPPGREAIQAAVLELSRDGAYEAEAVLAAAGAGVVPEVRPLLDSDNPDVRRRAAIVLLSVGSEVPLTVQDRVDLALFEITRKEGQPWSRLNGLLRLEGLGESAAPELRRVAETGGTRGKVARCLLDREQEET